MTISIRKEVLILSHQPPDELVWVAEVTITNSEAQARLTASGYTAVKYKLSLRGFYWTLTTEFSYSLYHADSSGEFFDSFTDQTYTINSGWNVIFYSQFPNGQIPPPMWIPDSWSDTPVGGATVTIPAHYETQTPPPVITYSNNEGWNAGAVSNQAVKGDSYFSFRSDDTNTGAVVGLNYASGAAYNYHDNDITHGIRTLGNQFQIIELGVTKTVAAAFVTADIFKIVFTALSVTYYKNGVLIYTSLTALTDNWLKLDCALYEAGDAVYDAKFLNGQLTSGVFLGEYATLAALQAAYPTATVGDYATVLGVEYIWNGAAWVIGDAPTVYADLAALQAAHPTATLDDYAILANGDVYTWDGAAWVISTIEISDDLMVYLSTVSNEFDIITSMPTTSTFSIKTAIPAVTNFIFSTGSLETAVNSFVMNTGMTTEAINTFGIKTELQQYTIAVNELGFNTDLRDPANTIINKIA